MGQSIDNVKQIYLGCTALFPVSYIVSIDIYLRNYGEIENNIIKKILLMHKSVFAKYENCGIEMVGLFSLHSIALARCMMFC